MTDDKNNSKSNRKQKKLQKKEREKKGGVNLLDIMIALCLLAVAALLFIVYSPLDLIAVRSDETDVIYSLRVSGVPADYASDINIGDNVSDSNGYELGTVATTVEVESHIMYVFDKTSGGIKAVVHPELVDLIITVSAIAEVHDDGYRIDGRRIAVEGLYDILLPGFEGEGICISLSEENANEVGGAK